MSVVSSILLLQTSGAGAQTITLLGENNPTQDISAASMMWVDTTGQRSVTQVVAARSSLNFLPSSEETVYALGSNAAL